MGPRDRRLTVCDSWTHLLEPREQPVKQRSDDARGPDPGHSLSLRLDARDAFAHKDVDDTETESLIKDGHASAKKHGVCQRTSISPADEPLTLSQERSVTECVDVIQKAARNETQKVRKQMISPSRSVLRGLMKCGHEHRGDSRDRALGSHQADSKEVKKHVNMHRRRSKW